MATGWPMKVSYANGDVYSASDVNDTNGTINLLTSSTLSLQGGKNCAINGGFDIWQRGTSSSGNAYIADRWYSALISGTGTFAQETTVIPSGGLYSMKFTASAVAQPALYQAVEQLNTIPYAGKTVTVSGLVAASTSVPMTIDVQHSSTANTAVTGSWTSITATSGGTATPTSTTFVSISGVYAIPSTAKSLRIRVFTTSTIASSVVVYFSNIQLELGSTATTFSRAGGTIQGELAACQRYYIRYGGNSLYEFIGMGLGQTATAAGFLIAFPVQMRIPPTSIEYQALALYDATAIIGSAVPTLVATTQGTKTVAVDGTVATGVIANRPYRLITNNSTSSYLGLNAEL
jgi:hypothetical protein